MKSLGPKRPSKIDRWPGLSWDWSAALEEIMYVGAPGPSSMRPVLWWLPIVRKMWEPGRLVILPRKKRMSAGLIEMGWELRAALAARICALGLTTWNGLS